MTNQNFCYWLQGFFELQPLTTELTPTQWSCIQKHLQLAKTYDQSNNSFVSYIEAFIDLLDGKHPTQNNVISLKKKLNSTFKHEIDPTQGDIKMQQKLNSIHNKLDNDPREELPSWLSTNELERC